MHYAELDDNKKSFILCKHKLKIIFSDCHMGLHKYG